MKIASRKNIQTYKCLFKSKDFLIFYYSVSSTNLEIFLLSEWAQSCIWNEESEFNKSFPLFYPKSFPCRKQKKNALGDEEKSLRFLAWPINYTLWVLAWFLCWLLRKTSGSRTCTVDRRWTGASSQMLKAKECLSFLEVCSLSDTFSCLPF